MIKLLECIPTPLEDCPQAIKTILKDVPGDPLVGHSDYQKFINEMSLMLRRLWTYSMIKDKSLMFAFPTGEATTFLGIKIEDGQEFFGEVSVPLQLSYEELEDGGMEILAKKFDAVYCMSLTKHIWSK